MTRKITVISGSTRVELSSEAVTWGELSRDIEAKGISLSNMRAFNLDNQNELSVPRAILPDSDNITIVLTAKKNKSGAELSRAECYEIAKQARQTEQGREIFAGYPSMTTSELNDAVRQWNRKSKKSFASSTESQAVATPATPSTSIKEVESKISQATALLEEAVSELRKHTCSGNSDLDQRVAALLAQVK